MAAPQPHERNGFCDVLQVKIEQITTLQNMDKLKIITMNLTDK